MMKAFGNKLSSRQILFYGGVGLLIICGIAFGWFILNRVRTPSSNPTAVVFVTPAAAEIASDPCSSPPAGWGAYTIQPGDTLSELAQETASSLARVLRANCLASTNLLLAGQEIYLPLPPTPTPCPPVKRADWVTYIVQSGDTLSHLAQERGTLPLEVVQANCLVSDVLQIGQELSLPPLPTPTPTPTATPLPTATPSPTATPLPTATPFPTATPLLTATPQPTPTASSFLQNGQAFVNALFQPVLNQNTQPQFPGSGQIPGGGTSPTIPGSPSNPFDDLLGSVPAVIIRPIQPNKGDQLGYVHCPQGIGETIDTYHDQFDRRVVELGQRRYFFACNFEPTSASVTRSDGVTQPVLWSKESGHPDVMLKRGARAVVDWPALPFYPLGVYTMTMTSRTVITPFTRMFEVVQPETEQRHILPIPLAGQPGDHFLVYYVNFNLGDQPKFRLYHAKRQVPNPYSPVDLKLASSWRVPITQRLDDDKGWAVNLLISNSTDIIGTYVISQSQLTNYRRIWLK